MLAANSPKIIIIGAGVAGISAACRLLEKGMTNVTILESGSRIGGRVHSVEIDGKFIDLGAQWCHGETDNIVYKMAKNYLKPSINNYTDNTFYLSNGSIIDKNITDRIFAIAMGIYEDEESAEKHTEGTFGDFFVEKYSRQLHEEFGNDANIKRISEMMVDWFHKFVRCIDAAPTWDDLSPRAPHYFIECDGDFQLNWADKGYKTIIDILMKKIPDPLHEIPVEKHIQFNKEVAHVCWDNKVTLKCADGSVFTCDHVIFTISIGCLKNLCKNFHPALPERKIEAIEMMKLGKVVKIFIKFDNKWWADDVKGFSFVWDDKERERILEEFPYGPWDGQRSWLEDVMGFYVIDSHPRMLLGWVVGKLVEDVENLPEDIVKDGCMFLLRKFAGNYQIPEAECILRTKWNTNPHFQGCWSYIDIEAEKKNIFPDDLATPVGDNCRILFAGEATHKTYFSAVHGAIESGYREAERLIEMYQNPPQAHYKVGIIGAGIAGLSAASTLYQSNIKDIIILEAQSSPGGRIQSLEYDKEVFELGAQWIHGKENPLYEIALKSNLLSKTTSEEGLGVYLRENGEPIDPDIVKFVDFQIGKILEECEGFLHSKSHPKSVGDFLQEKFEEYLQNSGDSEEVKTIKKDLFNWHVRFQIIDNSCKTLKDLSAKFWGQYVCVEDRAHFNLEKPFGSLIEILLGQIPGKNILLSTPVDEIKTGDKIDLICSNGRTIRCDHVIVTASLGVLKESLKFTPQLPGKLLKTIENLGFYGIGKIFLVFDERWWDGDGFQFVWSGEDAGEWTRNITGFDSVLNHPKVLLAWVGGNSVEIMENLSEEVVGIDCVNALRRFIKDRNVPNPRKVIRTKWMSNPYTRGAYCHITPLCDGANSGIEELAQPICTNGQMKILFAGEAVHVNHYSTAHGAFESGRDQAKILASFISRKSAKL